LTRFENEQVPGQLSDPVDHAFVTLEGELLEDASASNNIDEVLERLERATTEISPDEPLTGEAAFSTAGVDEEEDPALGQDVELDLSAGELDRSSDP